MSYFGGNLRPVLQFYGDYGFAEFYINPVTGSDLNEGSDTKPFKTIQHAIDQLPKNLNEDTEVDIVLQNATTYNEMVSISGFNGGYIAFTSEDWSPGNVILTSSPFSSILELEYNTTEIDIIGLVLRPYNNGTGISVYSCTNVSISDCQFSDRGGEYPVTGINIYQSNVIIENCVDEPAHDPIDQYGITIGDGAFVSWDGSGFGITPYHTWGGILSFGGFSGTVFS